MSFSTIGGSSMQPKYTEEEKIIFQKERTINLNEQWKSSESIGFIKSQLSLLQKENFSWKVYLVWEWTIDSDFDLWFLVDSFLFVYN